MDSYPLHLTGNCNISNVIFDSKNWVRTENRKAIVFHVSSYGKLKMTNVDMRGCFAEGGKVPSTPIIEVSNLGNECYIEINGVIIHNYADQSVNEKGLLISSESSKRITLMLKNCLSTPDFYGHSNRVTVVTGYTGFESDACLVDGSYILTNYVAKSSYLPFNKLGPPGIVDCPAVEQRNQNFVLCGDGVWRNISILMGGNP